MLKLVSYITPSGKDCIEEWIDGLRDREAKVAIARRFTRLENGNFGDCKSVGAGVSELRIKIGAGYCVYYARHGDEIVVLLCGGDKKTQKRDIEAAISYWRDWQERQKNERYN